MKHDWNKGRKERREEKEMVEIRKKYERKGNQIVGGKGEEGKIEKHKEERGKL